ncbi:hypothetical protein QUW50_08025 [Barnesiella viscericola]|nr:hypothetical protein [Barnesiella viscericola]MDM8268984.1 hypothetical protein [Barnesiella viscericola]
MTTLEFIVICILIPGLLGGIFAPMVVKGCKSLYAKWSNWRKPSRE